MGYACEQIGDQAEAQRYYNLAAVLGYPHQEGGDGAVALAPSRLSLRNQFQRTEDPTHANGEFDARLEPLETYTLRNNGLASVG